MPTTFASSVRSSSKLQKSGGKGHRACEEVKSRWVSKDPHRQKEKEGFMGGEKRGRRIDVKKRAGEAGV